MPRGTPIVPKCPKCKAGKYGYARAMSGCRPTGHVEKRLSRSNHSGHGGGGAGFYGYRGEVECLDCGHKWYSTHPSSGRVRWAPR